MGLDQSAYRLKGRTEKNKNIDFWDEREDDIVKRLEGINLLEIAEWRKHPHLQGYMEQLYQSKGGEDVFNTTYLVLTKQDILDLQETIKNKEFAVASGFFWGGDADDYYYDDDLKFCADALKVIEEGDEVVYWCWW